MEVLEERVSNLGIKNFASVFLVHIFKNIQHPNGQLRLCSNKYYSTPKEQVAFVEKTMYWVISQEGRKVVEIISDCLNVDAKITLIRLIDEAQKTIIKLEHEQPTDYKKKGYQMGMSVLRSHERKQGQFV